MTSHDPADDKRLEDGWLGGWVDGMNTVQLKIKMAYKLDIL